MARFQVGITVHRTQATDVVVAVEAATEEEAHQLALEHLRRTAGDLDFDGFETADPLVGLEECDWEWVDYQVMGPSSTPYSSTEAYGPDIDLTGGTPQPRITHAAIRFKGQTYALPAPARHHDVIRHICSITNEPTVTAYGDDQGFVDDQGRYLTREEAFIVAHTSRQTKRRCEVGAQLYSEDVW